MQVELCTTRVTISDFWAPYHIPSDTYEPITTPDFLVQFIQTDANLVNLTEFCDLWMAEIHAMACRDCAQTLPFNPRYMFLLPLIPHEFRLYVIKVAFAHVNLQVQ